MSFRETAAELGRLASVIRERSSKYREAVIEEVATAFEQDLGWHNDECPVTLGHPWYACACEVRSQAAAIRELSAVRR